MTVKVTLPMVGFLGAGKMATALARGFIDSGVSTSERIVATDVVPAAEQQFAEVSGAAIVSSLKDLCAQAKLIVVAVKPQQMTSVLAELRPHISDEHLVVSIAAGVTLASLDAGLGQGRLIRVMPNTPCLVGRSASAYALGPRATSADGEIVETLLASVGIVVNVAEQHLDAVTGLSGSGPAYVYQFIEALSDGGVRVGLPRHVATQLAAQTVLGAAAMVLETGDHPGALKDAVTSPGGTTIAGLHALERGGLRGTLMDAVEAATRRSQELS